MDGPRWPPEVPVAVVGPSSVEALAERGIAPPTYRVIAPAGAAPVGADAGDEPSNGVSTETEMSAGAPRFDSEALWSKLDTTPGAFADRKSVV